MGKYSPHLFSPLSPSGLFKNWKTILLIKKSFYFWSCLGEFKTEIVCKCKRATKKKPGENYPVYSIHTYICCVFFIIKILKILHLIHLLHFYTYFFIEKYTFNVKRPTTISCYQLFPTRIHERIPPKLATWLYSLYYQHQNQYQYL